MPRSKKQKSRHIEMKKKGKKGACLVGGLGDFPGRFGRGSGGIRSEVTLLPQDGGRVRRRRSSGVIGLEAEHVFTGADLGRRSTCRRRRKRRRRSKVRSKEFAFQQPGIRLVTPFLHRRWPVYKAKRVQARGGPTGDEPVTACA